MADAWKWAELDDKKMGLLKEAEETLGADYLLAFHTDGGDRPPQVNMQPASLDDSQVECLAGTEKLLDAVVIAYQKAA